MSRTTHNHYPGVKTPGFFAFFLQNSLIFCKYRMITTDGYGAADIVKNISRLDPSKRFVPGKTLLFFDELQEFPDIATSLKFFGLDGRFDVICNGSLLGLYYKNFKNENRETVYCYTVSRFLMFHIQNACRVGRHFLFFLVSGGRNSMPGLFLQFACTAF